MINIYVFDFFERYEVYFCFYCNFILKGKLKYFKIWYIGFCWVFIFIKVNLILEFVILDWFIEWIGYEELLCNVVFSIFCNIFYLRMINCYFYGLLVLLNFIKFVFFN